MSSADRNINVDEYLKRSYQYGLAHYPNLNEEEQIQKVYEHAIDKFGKNGYAVTKFFVKDEKYSKYLKELQKLIDNKDEFFIRVRVVNNIVKK